MVLLLAAQVHAEEVDADSTFFFFDIQSLTKVDKSCN